MAKFVSCKEISQVIVEDFISMYEQITPRSTIALHINVKLLFEENYKLLRNMGSSSSIFHEVNFKVLLQGGIL